MVSVAGDSVIGLIVSGFVAFLFVANAIHLNTARQEIQKPNANVTIPKGWTDFLFVANIILAVVVGAYFFYNLIRLFTTPKQREKAVGAVKGALVEPKAGVFPQLYGRKETRKRLKTRQSIPGTTRTPTVPSSQFSAM